MSSLAPYVTLGLLGALHCAGMCGGFAIAVTAGARSTRARWTRGASHVVGKALGYAVLGVLAASGAHALGDASGVRAALAMVAGGVLVLLGLAHFGVRLPAVAARPLRASFARVHRAAAALGGATGAFAIGVVHALLPCGLSWSAIALASQDAPPAAALGAFAFGLATAPGLALALAGAQLASARLRRVAPVVLGVALVAFGVWTMVRGTAASGTACCEEAPLSGATVERRHGPSFGEAARIEASACREGEGQELPPVAVSSRREDQGHVLRRSRLLGVRLETAGGGSAPARRPSRCSAGTADPPRPEVRGTW